MLLTYTTYVKQQQYSLANPKYYTFSLNLVPWRLTWKPHSVSDFHV